MEFNTELKIYRQCGPYLDSKTNCKKAYNIYGTPRYLNTAWVFDDIGDLVIF